MIFGAKTSGADTDRSGTIDITELEAAMVSIFFSHLSLTFLSHFALIFLTFLTSFPLTLSLSLSQSSHFAQTETGYLKGPRTEYRRDYLQK